MKSLIAPAIAVLCGLFALSSVSVAADAKKEGKKDEKAAADSKPINKKCPVEGGDVDPKVTLVHEGKTVGFCCAGCDSEFKKDPAKYMAVIAKEKEAELNKKCPVTGDDADKTLTTDYKGRTVAFCCEDCVKDFKKDPKKYLAKLEEEDKAKAKKEKDEKKSEEKKDDKAKE